MSRNIFLTEAKLNSLSRTSTEVKISFGTIVVVCIINALIIAYNIGYIHGWDTMYYLGVHYDSPHRGWPYTIDILRIFFTAVLALSAFGVWLHSRRGYTFSLIAFTLVILGYVWWYFESVEFLRGWEVSDYSQLHVPGLNHAGGLLKATWWDFVVLTITLGLIIQVITVLIRNRSNSFSSHMR